MVIGITKEQLDWLINDPERADYFENTMAALKRLNRVCIVGHGPSVREKPRGQDIDQCTVVRLKNCKRLLADKEHYGRRIDYAAASTETLKGLHGLGAKHVKEYWGYPKRGKYNAKVAQELQDLTGRPVWVPLTLTNDWNKRFRDLGGQHKNMSLGMAAIIMVCEKLKPENLFLAGFDTMLDPDKEYYTCLKERKGHPGHDWATEHILLDQVRAEYDTVIAPLWSE